MIFATAQLARRLKVPCRSGGSLCASKVADAQAAYESAHTLANFETAFYQSTIADYSSYEQWSLEGKLTAEQRANRVWKKMLAEYQDPGIDPAQDEAMLDFIARRKAVLSDTIDDE